MDVFGHPAAGKIELDYPGAYVVDYMSPLKAHGKWKIVNKILSIEQRLDEGNE